MTLNLIDPLWYKPSDVSIDSIMASLPSKDRGYDAFVLYELSLTDDAMDLKPLHSGERNGYTEEDRKRIEAGFSPIRKPEETCSIPSGRYLFEQFPAAFSSSDIPRLLLPYATKSGQIYIRFFKESILESVMQFMIPQ